MKLNKKNVALSFILGLTLVSSNIYISNSQVPNEEPKNQCEQYNINNKMMPRKSIFKQSIDNLEQEGVLNQEDINNIKQYCKEQRLL